MLAGPRELSINKQSAIQAIYGAQVHTTRSPFYIQASRDANKSSLIHTRIPAVHKLRKKAWERGLGPRGMTGCFHGPPSILLTREHKPWISTSRG